MTKKKHKILGIKIEIVREGGRTSIVGITDEKKIKEILAGSEYLRVMAGEEMGEVMGE